MASRGSFHNYIYPSSEFPYAATNTSSDDIHEFDEAEIWSSNGGSTMESKKKPMSVYRETKKASEKKKIKKASINIMSLKPGSSSVPLNIPDWSKFLQEEDDEEEEEDERVPPHEYLARRRGASFSVHEGVGRTLKGRDLRRVRNAVWKKTGFED